jgi:hypothetical protein
MFSLGFKRIFRSTVLVVCFVLSGCSISDSIGSLSNSSGSISTSSGSISDSSTSSGDGEKGSAQAESNRYENEIQDFTVTYLRTNSSVTDHNSFMKGISDVASSTKCIKRNLPITMPARWTACKKAMIATNN